MSHFALLMAELIMKLGRTGGKNPPASVFKRRENLFAGRKRLNQGQRHMRWP
jgi:hypothetical protein